MGFVFALIFKAVLGIPSSTPLFMFPADRRGGCARPAPGLSVGDKI